MKTSIRLLSASALLAVALGMLTSPAAEAIVGRPGTPVSVAGVARRSVRRTTVVVASSASASAASANAAAQQQAAAAQQQTAAANQAAAESAAAAASAQQAAAAAQQSAAAAQGTPALASLPPGRTPAGGDYNCGGAYYRPYFVSGTLVYKPVPAP
jgi:hypothetical protein